MKISQKEYELIYGKIPYELKDRIDMLSECKNEKQATKLAKLVELNIKNFKKIKWKTFKFIWYAVPSTSHRPRVTCAGGYAKIYVPGAAVNKIQFHKFFTNAYPNFKEIDTPMFVTVHGYLPTPKSFNKLEAILAEMGLIRPWNRLLDTDNFYKAATDQTIGALMKDDCLIGNIYGYKYYSIKPRIEYHIQYMEKFPEIIKKL